ncbi:hypothetical protein AXG93_115s1860 [Marchantia polymorpha subsp. ruderalis]|uniref:SAWADEE domain-containing protein n=1 Tax=Marchantia polymorpha subsp. ruderalis TaxID=1480154 RepID=A0A176W7W4_MARPO|nr:hypothetical protein AXG93_115s1860 [Marchantia polymorpha subsp. ruderalis]
MEGNNGCIPVCSVVQDLEQRLSGNQGSEGERVLPWRQVSQRPHNESASSKAKLRMKFLRHRSTASSSKAPVSSAIMPIPSSAPSSNVRARGMRLEAKSARDDAWFDVGTFLSHRVGRTGRPEVHVRFSGFRSKDDEWVDVRTSLRERSLPCEASDCVAILPGDLVLCFQERPDHALHFDADVQETKSSYAQSSACSSSEAASSINAPPALETFPAQPLPVICMQAVHNTSATSGASQLVVTSEGIPQAIIVS